MRQHGVAQERAQSVAELVGLGVDQRHRVRVVGAVGRVGVHHHVRVPARHQLVEQLGVQGVALDEVAIEVQVAAVAAEAELLGTVLVHARRVGTVERAVDVIQRHEQQHGRAQRGQPGRIEAQVAHHGHAGVHAFRLARVDAVVVEEHGAALRLDQVTVEHAVRADHARMHGDAAIGDADLFKPQHLREAEHGGMADGVLPCLVSTWARCQVQGRDCIIAAHFLSASRACLSCLKEINWPPWCTGPMYIRAGGDDAKQTRDGGNHGNGGDIGAGVPHGAGADRAALRGGSASGENLVGWCGQAAAGPGGAGGPRTGADPLRGVGDPHRGYRCGCLQRRRRASLAGGRFAGGDACHCRPLQRTGAAGVAARSGRGIAGAGRRRDDPAHDAGPGDGTALLSHADLGCAAPAQGQGAIARDGHAGRARDDAGLAAAAARRGPGAAARAGAAGAVHAGAAAQAADAGGADAGRLCIFRHQALSPKPSRRPGADPVPGGVGVDEFFQELPGAVVVQFAVGTEQVGSAADVHLGLLQHRHVEEHQRLAHVVIGAERTGGAGRDADHAGGLAAPHAAAVRTRADVQRVLQRTGGGAVVFGGEEQHAVEFLDAVAELGPRLRRDGAVFFQVLVVERQFADFHDFQRQRCRRQGHYFLCELAVDRRFAQAADNHGDFLVFWEGRAAPADCSVWCMHDLTSNGKKHGQLEDDIYQGNGARLAGQPGLHGRAGAALEPGSRQPVRGRECRQPLPVGRHGVLSESAHHQIHAGGLRDPPCQLALLGQPVRAGCRQGAATPIGGQHAGRVCSRLGRGVFRRLRAHAQAAATGLRPARLTQIDGAGVVRVVHVFHVPQDVAQVDLDRARHGLVEVPVGDDGVERAVEGQADPFAFAVQRGRAGVAAGDVQRRQVRDRYRFQRRVHILAEVLGLDGRQLRWRCVELARARSLGGDAGHGGERFPVAAVRTRLAAGDLAEGHAQRAVGVRVHGLALAVHVGDFSLHVVGVRLLQLAAQVFFLLFIFQVRTVQCHGRLDEAVVAGLEVGRLLVDPRGAGVGVAELTAGVELDQRGLQVGAGHAVLDAHHLVEGRVALGGRLRGVLDQTVQDQRLVHFFIVVAHQRGHARLDARHVADLVAGLALGVRLGVFVGQAVQHARRVEQARLGRRQEVIALGVRIALGDQLFHGRDIGCVVLPAARVGIDPLFQRFMLGGLAGQHVAARVRVQHALAVLVVIVDAGDLRRILERSVLVVLGGLGNDGQVLARGFHEGRVVPVERERHFRRQAVAVGAAGVAQDHDEVAFLHALLGQFQVVLRHVGDIVLAVVGGLAIAADVGAIKTVVARVARPHPVVGVAAELAHAFGRGVHQAHVADFQLLGQVELEAAVERRHGAAVAGVFFALGLDGLAVFFDGVQARLAGELGHGWRDHLFADVGDGLGHPDAAAWRGRQFLAQGLGQETVGQQVALGRRIVGHAAVHAVVVGGDQALRRDERGRATTEADDGAHRELGQLGQRGGVQRQAGGFQLLSYLWQLLWHPHAFRHEYINKKSPAVHARWRAGRRRPSKNLVGLDRFDLDRQFHFGREVGQADIEAEIAALELGRGVGAARLFFVARVIDAFELVDLQCHRPGHAHHGQLAFNTDQLVAIELERLAGIGHGRELGHVEHGVVPGVLVHRVEAEVDRVGLDRHIQGTGPGGRIERYRAAGLVELAAPDRQAHVVGLETRERVRRVQVVGRAGGHAGRGGRSQQRGNQDLQFHALSQTLDRQHTVKHLLAAFGLDGQREGDVGGLALDGQLAGHGQLAGARALDRARHESRFRELGGVEPFLLAHFLVVLGVAHVEAGRVHFHRGLGRIRLGGVVVDGGGKFLEFRVDRHIHLLEGGADGALGGVRFEDGGAGDQADAQQGNEGKLIQGFHGGSGMAHNGARHRHDQHVVHGLQQRLQFRVGLDNQRQLDQLEVHDRHAGRAAVQIAGDRCGKHQEIQQVVHGFRQQVLDVRDAGQRRRRLVGQAPQQADGGQAQHGHAQPFMPRKIFQLGGREARDGDHGQAQEKGADDHQGDQPVQQHGCLGVALHEVLQKLVRVRTKSDYSKEIIPLLNNSLNQDGFSQRRGDADVVGRRHGQQAVLGWLRNRQAGDEVAQRVLRDALAAREFLQLLVRILDAVAAHHGLHRLGQHFPVGVQVGFQAGRIDFQLVQAAQAAVVGQQGVAEADADVAQHGRIGEVALQARDRQFFRQVFQDGVGQAQVQQNRVGARERIEQFGHVVVRFDLDRVRVEHQAQALLDHGLRERGPVERRVRRQVGVVVAHGAVHLAQDFHLLDTLDRALQARYNVGHFLAQRGGAGGLAVRARQHRQVGIGVGDLGQPGDHVAQRRQHHGVARGLEHHAVRRVVDVFRRAGKVDELGGGHQFRHVLHLFLEPVLHGLDVVVGDRFDFLDAGGVRFGKIAGDLVEQGGAFGRERLDFIEAGQRQRLQPRDFHLDAVVHEAGLGQDGTQQIGFTGVTAVQRGQRRQRGVRSSGHDRTWKGE
uniref:Uncharacterized protein n=1 Tax=Tanacetum cinerariifolium TaxID=118510 RepID=A0A699GLN6_TANCI|nr:hypothetical protein [Tanacetum cinerariifolium]